MPPAILIAGCTFLGGARGDILVSGGKIRRIGRGLPAKGARIVRAKGLLASPGLIDTQVNGGFGRSFSTATPGQTLEIGRGFLAFGVTSYLPTIISLPREQILRGIASLRAAAGMSGGARILGIHLEGPFLSPSRRGAHRPENLREPSLEEFREYLEAAGGLLRMMTLAPERPGALDVIREGARRRVVMSAGHSPATAEEVRRAVKAGVRHVTHVFNGMAPLHHRHETILNESLQNDRLSCGMIYDREHLSAGTARLLMKLKPPGSIVLVSDATSALGCPDGDLSSDGDHYVIRKGRVTVRGTETLAGSAASLLEGVRRLVADTGVAVAEAVAMASAAPARLLGLQGKKGVLRAGADADIVLFDSKLRVKMAFVEGELLYPFDS